MGWDVVGIEFLRTRPYWLRLAIVAAVYYGAGVLGLRLSLVGRSVTPLWPPTGVAVVALLALGRRHWPAIGLAAFAINAPISPNLGAALLISVGNTVAPVVAVTLLTRIGLSTDLERVRDASALVFLGALASMTISATVGSLALLRSSAIPASHFVGTWSVWWTGDAMGVLIVAPLLWSLRPVPPYATRRSVTETIAIAMLLLAACAVALNGTVQLLFLVVPAVGVIAWRYGQRGAARANLCVSLAATVVAAHGFGPFAGLSLVGRMVKLQSFNATVAFTSILLAAAVAERERLAAQQRAAVETLQRSLLPDRIYDAPGLEFAARYIPASRELALGGDWYDVISLSEGSYGFVVGDVAGHGALAAAVMGKLRMAIRAYARESLPPVQILRRVNTLLRDIHERSTATLWIGLYNPAEHEVVFANAGHVPPLLVDASEGARFLDDVHGPPIGAVDGATYGESRRLLLPGSTLLLYTDGLVERRGRSIDDGMADLYARVGTDIADLEAMCDGALGLVHSAASDDDVAVLAIRVHSLAGYALHVRRPAVPASIPETRRALHTWLTDNGVPEYDAFEILVATTEACSNVVAHAYGLDAGTVDLTTTLTGADLRIVVRDDGVWRSDPATNQHGGRGLRIMRSLMDRVEIVNGPGTEVRMERRLNGARRPE